MFDQIWFWEHGSNLASSGPQGGVRVFAEYLRENNVQDVFLNWSELTCEIKFRLVKCLTQRA